MASAGERVPVRLVKENGETISLDATSIDMIVERQQSNFGIPLMHAKRMAIDLNQASVTFEIQGVFADDEGQEETSQATLDVDFYQEHTYYDSKLGLYQTGQNVSEGNSKADTGAKDFPSSKSRGDRLFSLVGQRPQSVLANWHHKFLELPVAYWTENNASLTLPVTSNLQLHLKADNINLNNLEKVSSWTDASGFSRDFTQGTSASQPTYRVNGANGKSFVEFDGSNDHLSLAYTSAINGSNLTIFTVYTPFDENSSATDGILTSKSSSAGYGIRYNGSVDATGLGFVTSGPTLNELNSGSNTFEIRGDPAITTAKISAGDIDLRLNGSQVATNSGTYVPLGSGNAYVGADFASSLQNYFKGHIYEIIVYDSALSDNNIQLVEGYLARKYNLSEQLDGKHSFSDPYNFASNLSIAVAFDSTKVGSKKEPYYYVNKDRATDMVVDSVSGNVITLTSGSPNPQEWFELSQSTGRYYINAYQSSSDVLIQTGIAEVTAVNDSPKTITVNPIDFATSSFSNGHRIVMVNLDSLEFSSTESRPVIMIPIGNANQAIDPANVDKALGPTFPNFANGDTRGTAYGSGLSRTDEFLAFMLSKALTEGTDSWFHLTKTRSINATGSKLIKDVFTTEILESASGNNARVRVTQVYATSLGAMKNQIITNFDANQVPILHGFTGGKSGKKVKSAGDKVQDILGILGNSQNKEAIQDQQPAGFLQKLLDQGSKITQQTFYQSEEAMGDFISAIQIPYDTMVTFGQASDDIITAQRNHFITTLTGITTVNKLSNVNTVHASDIYSPTHQGHLKNGISGLISEFNVNRDAEMKVYTFALKFVAADIIM